MRNVFRICFGKGIVVGLLIGVSLLSWIFLSVEAKVRHLTIANCSFVQFGRDEAALRLTLKESEAELVIPLTEGARTYGSLPDYVLVHERELQHSLPAGKTTTIKTMDCTITRRGDVIEVNWDDGKTCADGKFPVRECLP